MPIKYKALLSLFLITILGLILRLHQLSPFKIYPDSYQTLLVVENLRSYHSVIGTLGTNGMFYPDFIPWTRPGFPLLILLFSFVIKNTDLIAQIISFLAGIIAIPLSYILIKQFFKSPKYALCGSLIIALSFYHTLWSGFIMTESIGVVSILIFLIVLFKALESKNNLYSVLTGVFLAFAVITRYEYSLLILPLLFLLWQEKKFSKKAPMIFSSFIAILCTIFIFLFPVNETFNVIRVQLSDILIRATLFSAVISFIFILANRFKDRLKPSYILAALLLILIFLKVPFLIYMIKNEPLISLLSIIGFFLMLQKKGLRIIVLFTILSLFLLGFVYYRSNPEMDRYITHLIPFLLIPASFGFVEMINKLTGKLGWLVVGILVVLQVIISFNGLHSQKNASWYRASYEQLSAMKVRGLSKDDLLLVALPEPYYYFTRRSTYSITDTPPFLYIGNDLDQKQIVIVKDMGMEKYFPNFTKFVKANLQDKKTSSFYVHENFLLQNYVYEENQPVEIYKIQLAELKKRISNFPR